MEWAQHCRRKGFPIIYQDDKCVFKNMKLSRVWQQSSQRAPVHYKVSSGTGDWSTICHFGSRQTELSDSYRLFFTKQGKVDPDYHFIMNRTVFMNWLRKILIPKLQLMAGNFFLLLDRAKCHSKLTPVTCYPLMSWAKERMVNVARKWGYGSQRLAYFVDE